MSAVLQLAFVRSQQHRQVALTNEIVVVEVCDVVITRFEGRDARTTQVRRNGRDARTTRNRLEAAATRNARTNDRICTEANISATSSGDAAITIRFSPTDDAAP